MTDTPKDRLIESIYRIALEPQTYDSFMGHWDEYIHERLGELSELRAEAEASGLSDEDDGLGTHFEIATQLLSQMVQKEDTEAKGSRDPELLVNGAGDVVWFNAAAERELGVHRGSSIKELALEPRQRAQLEALCEGLGLTAVSPTVLLTLEGKETGKPFYFKTSVVSDRQQDDLIVISKLTPDWPAEMPPLLSDAFGMSPSEVDICRMLADGQSVADIAEARESAVATVRTQVKKVLGKAGCSSQAELVRVLHSVMRVADEVKAPALMRSAGEERMLYVNLEDRAMPVAQFGPAKGRPVISFHGMLCGIGVPKPCQEELKARGLRLLCPIRPWFGTAEGTQGPVRDAPEAFGRDVLEMMRQLELPQAALLGHMGGVVYAYATASQAAEGQISGLVSCAGGVPLQTKAQFAAMSRRQRLVAYTARYTPAILPFVLRAGISQMQSGGATQFIRSLFENTPEDLALLDREDIAALLLSGHRFSVAQGHRAFELDSYHVVRDWSRFVDGTSQPVKVLHGVHDPAVSISSVRNFYKAREVEVTELNGGQLFFYDTFEPVLDALESVMGNG